MKDKVFINQNFMLLWSGQFISRMGDKLYAIALAWWILNKTGSPLSMGLLLTCSLLPQILLGPLAGAYVDRLDRRLILIWADVIRGVLVIAVSILAWSDFMNVWIVFLFTIAISLSSAFFDPASKSIISQIVDRNQISKANSLSEASGGICTVVGPILGAILVNFIGYAPVFMLNGISFLLSGVLEFFLKISFMSQERCKKNILSDIKEGIRFSAGSKRILIIIIIIAVAHLFVGCIQVIAPVLARQIRGDGIKNLSYLETAMGFGAICGALYNNFKDAVVKDSKLFIYIMMIGVCFIYVGAFNVVGVDIKLPYLLVMFVIGIIIVNASILWQSLIQMNTPVSMVGRVFSLSTLAGNLSLPISFSIFGLLLDKFAVFSVALASGVCLVLICFIIFAFVSNE